MLSMLVPDMMPRTSCSFILRVRGPEKCARTLRANCGLVHQAVVTERPQDLAGNGGGAHLSFNAPTHAALASFFTSTFELRPLCSYFSRRVGGRSSGVPSAKPPLDWK